MKPSFEIVRRNGDFAWKIVCKQGENLSLVVGKFRTRTNALLEIQSCRDCVLELEDEYFQRDIELWYPEFYCLLRHQYRFYDDYDESVVAELLQENYEGGMNIGKYATDEPIEFYDWMAEKLKQRRFQSRGWG